jgi:hypothetical protein
MTDSDDRLVRLTEIQCWRGTELQMGTHY